MAPAIPRRGGNVVELSNLTSGDYVRCLPMPDHREVSGQVLTVGPAGVAILADGDDPNFLKGTPVSATPAAVREVERKGHGELPDSIVRTYMGPSQADATKSFQVEAAIFGEAGYVPTTQSWAA